MPKVSVILTSYNHGKYLREAIDSVLAQTFQDYELIIWDDASTDDSWEIIQSYADPRVKARRSEQTRRYVINRALAEMSSGEYIAIHHSDDVWEPEKLEKQVAFLDAHPQIGAVFTNALAIGEDSQPLDDPDHFYASVFDQPNRTRHQWLNHFFNHGNALCHPSVLIRRQCYDDCGAYRYGLAQFTDFDMWVRLCLKYEIQVLAERLVKFRVRRGEANSSGSRPEVRIRSYAEYHPLLRNYLRLHSAEEVLEIFPDAQAYIANPSKQAHPAFILARLLLEEARPAYYKQLGLEILFELLADSRDAQQVSEAHGFDYLDLIRLTGREDPFAIEKVRVDAARLAKCEEEVTELRKRPAHAHPSLGSRLPAIGHLAPIRQFLALARNFRVAWSRMSSFNGGFIGVARSVRRVSRREGVSGVWLRLVAAAQGRRVRAEGERALYSRWVRRYDTLRNSDRKNIRREISLLRRRPLISIIMPVYNPPLDMLKEAIASAQSQLYPNWELCIADDASTDDGVREVLEAYAANDARIKVIFRERNGHISAASNSALELATGEFIALLDNDDRLPEHALYWLVQTLAEHPDAGLIYSDEDKIDEAGNRYDPYFKPDWNPDLFLSHNMICHLGVYRATLVREVGGFREGFEGAQDYDLALRCVERLAPAQIVHIPRVLYHWRSHAGSTAKAGTEKRYALLAGERALNDHFARDGVNAKAKLLEFGMYRAHYALPHPSPLVSLIIPTRNGLELVRQCVSSIIDKTVYENYEILIVDNNSDDPGALEYFKSIAADPRIRVIRDERPFNYSALNNAAVAHARGEYIGLINNDIEVISHEWLNEMMSLAAQPGVGAVGARLWYPNDTLQHAGVVTGIGGVAGHAHKHTPKGQFGYFSRAQLIQTLSAVTAACLIIKKSIYQEVGGLDETNLAVAFNDVDFCLRVREAGYRNMWTPYAELYHHESATRGYEDTRLKQRRFRKEMKCMKKRWAEKLEHDPAYNPNLTLDHEDFSLAWPPRRKR